MTRKQSTRETRTIQTWPGGGSFTYRGDPDGPANQKSLRTGYHHETEGNPWRKGTAAEWRAIRVCLRAELYASREIYHCDSSLVDELIKAASDSRGDLAEAFGYDEIRNLYTDLSDADAATVREYASDEGIDLPDVPTVECPICHGEKCSPNDAALPCPVCGIAGEVPEDGYEEDDSRRGWLTEARQVCQERASENPAEVYEWYRVSPWLCAKLHELGYVTIDNNYGEWWGRTCTGQGVIMDGTLQRVAAMFEEEEK